MWTLTDSCPQSQCLQLEWPGSGKAGQTLALGSELSYYVMRTIFRSMICTLLYIYNI